MSETLHNQGVRLEVRSVGGISDASVTLGEGVTLISGANASNKSSLLRSLCGVLGGPVPPIKSDAERGSVRMTVDGTEYGLELAREDGETTVVDADRYSEARDLCELFVSLTETNPVRQAVQAGTGLYELLMRPVDTDAIRAEISRLRAEKANLDDRLEELDAMESRLPGLRTRQNSLEAELSAVEASLRETRDEVEAMETVSEGAEAGSVEAELNERRTERSRLRERIRTNEDAVESLREELETVEAQLEEVEAVEVDVGELESELEQLHYRKQQLTSTINALGPLVDMNEQLLDEGAAVPEEMTDGDVVGELDPASRSITCWTCGSTVDRGQIADQIEAVQDIVREKRNQRDTITERIQVVTEQKRELEQRQDERERLRERRAALNEEIDQRERTLTGLRADVRDLEREIDDLQGRIETTEAGEQLSEYYDEIGDLEYERGALASELESVAAEIGEIEAELSGRETVETRREAVVEELRRQRERIETLERELVSTFNREIQEVLDALNYRSIERVWLERRSSGETPDTDTEFELHVVRESGDGTAYEETIDNLSKSERSVIGLVVALAGYLAHDVGQEVPFVVVDAVEMFDAGRISGLMEHFEAHADYVVGTVLPEDGDRLDGVYQTIATSAIAVDT